MKTTVTSSGVEKRNTSVIFIKGITALTAQRQNLQGMSRGNGRNILEGLQRGKKENTQIMNTITSQISNLSSNLSNHRGFVYLVIVDAYGHDIAMYELKEGRSELQIDVSGYAEGTYFYGVRTYTGNCSFKKFVIIKQN